MKSLALLTVLGAGVVFGAGFLLDTPQPDPPRSDAIIVISGDEQMARYHEGVRLFHAGYGRVLVFSGAARDGAISNAQVMRDLAVEEGVPPSAILEDPHGENTWGNAVYTRDVLEQQGLESAIVVTSPYHARRAKLTFEAAYAGSGISLTVRAAPDSAWRKQTWWQGSDTRELTVAELEKLVYIGVTGRYY